MRSIFMLILRLNINEIFTDDDDDDDNVMFGDYDHNALADCDNYKEGPCQIL